MKAQGAAKERIRQDQEAREEQERLEQTPDYWRGKLVELEVGLKAAIGLKSQQGIVSAKKGIVTASERLIALLGPEDGVEIATLRHRIEQVGK